MVFYELMDWAVTVLLFILLVSQAIVPLFRGTPLFPAFRRKRRNLAEELARAEEELKNAELTARIMAARRKSEELWERAYSGDSISPSAAEGDGSTPGTESGAKTKQDRRYEQ